MLLKYLHNNIINNNIVNSAAGSTLDPTIDFGIVRRYSLGNRVWNDSNNNGVRDGGEVGISGVIVRLYRSDGVTINPSGGALAANVVMAAGLSRIGEAAQRIIDGSAGRALVRASLRVRR